MAEILKSSRGVNVKLWVIIGAVVVAAIILIYFFFFRSDGNIEPLEALLLPGSNDIAVYSVPEINNNHHMFTDQKYVELRLFTKLPISVQEEHRGRPNPFLPFDEAQAEAILSQIEQEAQSLPDIPPIVDEQGETMDEAMMKEGEKK